MKKQFVPLRFRVKTEILKLIESRELKKGDRLPPERSLAIKLKASRLIVSQALSDLETEGVIVKIRGSGSYVNTEREDANGEELFVQIAAHTEVEISFGTFNPSPQYELLLKTFAGLFQMENPSIKVSIHSIRPPENEYADAFLLRLGGGNPPTAGEFFLHAEYAALDSLYPLEMLPGYDALADSLRPRCAYKTKDAAGKEHTHALALKINSRVVLANADLLSEAGIDCDVEHLDFALLEEWSAILGDYAKRKRTGVHGVFMEIPNGWHGVIGNMPYLWGARGVGFENSLEGFLKMISSTQCRRGLEFLSRVKSKGSPLTENRLELFACGQIGITLSGGVWPLELLDAMHRHFDLRAFPIPSFEGKSPASSVMGGFHVGIFRSGVKDEKELDAAWKWLKFLFRKRQQHAIGFDYNFPAVKNTACPFAERHSELSKVFEKSLENSIPQFDFKNLRGALSILGEEMNNSFSGASSEECLARAALKVDALRMCP